jgi:hypothetical protein
MEEENIEELYLIQWSEKQQVFHVDKIKQILKNNLHSYIRNREIEYFPVAIAHTYEEAETIAKLLEQERVKNLGIQEIPSQ